MATEIQKDLRNHEVETAWEYQAEAQKLYQVGEMMMNRFFNGLVYPDGRAVPAPVFAFEDLRNYRTLAQYYLVPDAYGISHRIDMNTQHYVDTDNGKKWMYGEIAKYETALHEMVHTWQQAKGADPYRRGSKQTHNAEFTAKCNELGLHPKTGPGYHIAPPDRESPFGVLMKDLNIAWDVAEVVPDGRTPWFIIIDSGNRGERRGRSSLAKWSCGCQNIRVGTENFYGVCTKEDCGKPFVRIVERRVR